MTIRYTEEELHDVAKSILKSPLNKVICFYGQMGAGKTTLIKVLVKELGCADSGSSPTFGIVNEYHTSEGDLLAYHFDFYRLNDETEALDLGFEDYLNQKAWVLIEWPEKIDSLLPKKVTDMHIEVLNPNTRKITITHQ
ncbi:MAG: tRNA (adenosine(37)-N6)-threonylcarbamoyltransferase complex ATPase subunit type 1 TsaE [Pricia sp.]|nr:tRNA (adenosine(37)-N6)-threonylcarbamoyltransferase complex ATPase subunit type 1 TsaE [Pricia sp.]